jgi:gamma-glutamyltranspeptidase / glutathione hydrolase
MALLATALQRGPALVGPAQEEPGDTTHLTVADDAGNVVALTQSIQSVFGAKVANEKLGFLYNNYLRTCPRQAHPARLAPRCLSRSNVSPTLILREGRPFLALGSAGSRRITSSLLQVTSNVVDREMTLEEAVAAPRVHALLSGTVWMEAGTDQPHLLEQLAQRFHKTVERRPLSFSMGAVQALQFLPGRTLAAADPRRDGTGAVLPEGAKP